MFFTICREDGSSMQWKEPELASPHPVLAPSLRGSPTFTVSAFSWATVKIGNNLYKLTDPVINSNHSIKFASLFCHYMMMGVERGIRCLQ